VAPGLASAVVDYGMNYNGFYSSWPDTSAENFGGGVPVGAFQAISLLGTTIVVWEMN
jgi:hypothetical protein